MTILTADIVDDKALTNVSGSETQLRTALVALHCHIISEFDSIEKGIKFLHTALIASSTLMTEIENESEK